MDKDIDVQLKFHLKQPEVIVVDNNPGTHATKNSDLLKARHENIMSPKSFLEGQLTMIYNSSNTPKDIELRVVGGIVSKYDEKLEDVS